MQRKPWMVSFTSPVFFVPPPPRNGGDHHARLGHGVTHIDLEKDGIEVTDRGEYVVLQGHGHATCVPKGQVIMHYRAEAKPATKRAPKK